MRKSVTILFRILGTKLAIFLIIGGSAVAAYAALGDGRQGLHRSSAPVFLLSNKSRTNTSNFSLRSGYSFRGSQVIASQEEKFVNFNTTISYQRGNTTYIMPIRKKVILSNVKLDLSNRSLRRY